MIASNGMEVHTGYITKNSRDPIWGINVAGNMLTMTHEQARALFEFCQSEEGRRCLT